MQIIEYEKVEKFIGSHRTGRGRSRWEGERKSMARVEVRQKRSWESGLAQKPAV